MLTGQVLDGRFEALDAVDYDLPGVDRQRGRDTRLNSAVILDTVTSVAPTSVRRAALRAMSVRDPRLARIVAVQGGAASAPTTIVSEPLPGVRLDTVLSRRRLPEAKARAVVGEAARALAVASAAGVHHGWVRPACISVDSSGRVIVAGVGVEGELALQAGLRRGKGEAADATALARVFLACITGRDPDSATASDIPESTGDASRALCEKAIAGKSVDSLSALANVLGAFDTRLLRGLPASVDSLPLSLVGTAKAEQRRKRDRIAAAHRAFRGPRVTGGVTISRETIVEAAVEAEAVSGAIPLVIQGTPVPPAGVEPEVLEDLHDILTFEAMVDEQVAGARPTIPELFYERLHSRWPNSRRITRRLERAHHRAINGGPINATPIVMVLVAGGLIFLVMTAVTMLSQGFGGADNPGTDLSNYPSYTYGP